MNTFDTQLRNHFNHARLLNGRRVRWKMLEKTAHYTNVFFFVFGLAPLTRYCFSTPTISSSQALITAACWFVVTGATVCGWEAWKRRALRSYSAPQRIAENADKISDEEYIQRICAAFAHLPQSKEFGEELQKMQHKEMPMLWWDELNDMVREQSPQTIEVVNWAEKNTEGAHPHLPQKIHV